MHIRYIEVRFVICRVVPWGSPYLGVRVMLVNDVGRVCIVLGAVYVSTRLIARLLRSRRGGVQAPTSGYFELVGNTPLVRLAHLSDLLQCEVYGKAEFVNPGGSVKDRVAKAVVEDILERNRKPQNERSITTIYEGTSGSTGISLCMAAASVGLKSVIYMPDDQAIEKRNIISALGGEVRLVRPMSIVDAGHMCKAAKTAADMDPHGLFVDQFENPLNFKTHFRNTAVEIIHQTRSKVNVFVASAGTGGTISGISARLKLQRLKNFKSILADCQGSALANKVTTGTLFNPKDKEGHRIKHPFDTVTEGIGLNRLTHNFNLGIPFIDHALTVSDQEAVDMSRYLLETEGLFLGSSSAVNCACIVKAAKRGLIKPGDTVVTILCDSGQRHLSKFWSTPYLEQLGLHQTRSRSPLEFID